MNSFVDSPFLFFVDNVPPIFAENPGEDQRKIIEIFDAGCDAITSTMPTRNNSQYPPARTTTVRPRYEEKFVHKFYKEKCRENEEVAKNLEKPFSTYTQFENVHCPNIDEHRWKKPTTHNELNDSPPPKKTPNTKDIKMNPKVPSERPRLNRWNKGNVQELPYDHAVSNSERRPTSCPTRMRPILHSPLPKVESKIDAKIVPKVEEKFIFDKRNTIVPLEPDYPEVFDRKLSKHRWQLRAPTSTNLKKPIDEPPQKTQRSSRYQKPTRIGAAKANNPEQTTEDLPTRRLRSRTRSPPSDRQKRTQSFLKSPRNDLEQVENQQNAETVRDPNSPVYNFDSDQSGSVMCSRSIDKIRKFVDRGVDKDSICDISEVSTSTDGAMVAKSSVDTGKSEKIIGFWEFVSLEDENDPRWMNRKTRCLLDHRMFRDRDYHPLRRQLVNDDDPYASKSRFQESTKNNLDPGRNFISENLKYTDHCSLPNPGDPGTIKGDNGLHSDAYRREESARSVEVLHRTRLNSQTEVNAGHNREKLHSNCDTAAKYYCSQSCGEPKHQPKSAHALSFGWPGKSRHLKRENNAEHGEESGKKKKLQNEEKPSGLKFIGKTAACLKRKLEGSQKEDSDLEKSSRLNIEKKIRSEVSTNSKLPIRIGKRLKSKNPIAWKIRDSWKSELPDKEQDKGPEYISTARSRTKPRIKPSVELHRIVIDSNDTPACPVSVDNVRTENQSINGRGEKLGERLKHVEQDSRRKAFANRFYERNGQEHGTMERMDINITRNIGMKEKCFFHVHDEENRICDQYCKGMRCEKVCQ